MEIFSKILEGLGYKKVIGILDSNKEKICKQLNRQHKNYRYITIPEEDIRDKSIQNKNISGICLKICILKEECKEEIRNIFQQINGYFNS